MAARGGTTATFAVLGDPGILAPHTLPGHRAVRLTLVNTGDRPEMVAANDLSLFAAGGERLHAIVTFDRESGGPGAMVQAKQAALAPGHGVAVVVVWRDADAARLRYPGGAVELERAATSEPRA
jgi:hypothetical protein